MENRCAAWFRLRATPHIEEVPFEVESQLWCLHEEKGRWNGVGGRTCRSVVESSLV